MKDILSEDKIIDLFKNKKIDKEWSFSEYKPSDTSKWTNCYHRYPAKFIPQLVEKLIDEYIPNKVAYINDPFMGCGTTIVTAISKGFRASGTDINKIAYLITKVKSKVIEPNYLSRKIDQFLSKMIFLKDHQMLFNEKIEPFIPKKHIERINYWFTEENKNELGKILRVIYDEKDENIKDFLLVAFSNILKNCSIWLQGSTKPTKDLKKKQIKPYDVLIKHLKKMKRGNEAFFIDMEEVFDESFRILKSGSRCCYVIGDTKLKGVDILNAEVFADSLQF